MIPSKRKNRVRDALEIKKIFYCPNCGGNKTIDPIQGKHDSETPVGYLRVVTAVAVCPDCGRELHNDSLDNFNSIVMASAAIAEYRKKYPDGTKKQCRRKLGLQEETVRAFWDKDEFLEYEVL